MGSLAEPLVLKNFCFCMLLEIGCILIGLFFGDHLIYAVLTWGTDGRGLVFVLSTFSMGVLGFFVLVWEVTDCTVLFGLVLGMASFVTSAVLAIALREDPGMDEIFHTFALEASFRLRGFLDSSRRKKKDNRDVGGISS